MHYSQYINDKNLTRQKDTRSGKYRITIKMGGFYITDRDEIISTMLGSCIAVCARDRTSGIGGMNHFMLPAHSIPNSNQWENTLVNTATRYGTFAMEYLINEILSKGGRKNNLEFKIFGGCNILGSATSIGTRNVCFIKDYMDTEGYSIAAESLGGFHPIVLNFHIKSGRVKIKRLDEKAPEIATNEKHYMHELQKEQFDDDITIY